MISFAACGDGLHVAILDGGRLAIYALDGSGLGAPVATAAVAGETVLACGAAVLVLDDGPDATQVTAFAVPSLAPLSALELNGRVRWLATAGPTALFARADEAFLVVLGDGTLSTAALRPPSLFTRAVGVDDDQLLTFGDRGTELWTPSQRRPTARLGLALPPDVTGLGVTLRNSALWMASGQPMIQTARISDGRIVTLRLGSVPRHVTGHPGSSYLLAELDGRPVAINLALRQLEPLDPGPGTIIGQTVGADRIARVVVRLGDRVVATALGGDGALATALVEPAPAATTVGPTAPSPRPDTAVITTPPRAVTPVGRPATRTEVGSTGADEATTTATAPTSPTATASTSATATVSTSATAPTATAPTSATATAPTSPSAIAAVAPSPVPSVPTSMGPSPWRAELVAWLRAGDGAPVPTAVTHALAPTIARAGLAPAAAALVAAGYGSWLLGDGATGAPIATLASACGDWREACGAGAVAALGLMSWDRGRARLEPALGEFLDEQRPRGVTVIGAGPPGPPPAGVHELEPGESAELADRHGAVALGGADVARARLEAWLRGLALVTDARIDVASLRPGEAIYLLPRR